MRYRVKAVRTGEGVVTLPVEALTEKDAAIHIERQGYGVLSIRSEGFSTLVSQRRQRPFSVLEFSQELVALLEAGLTLVEAIEAICEKEADAARRAFLATVLERLKQGKRFSSAIEPFSEAFPALYVATIRASERTGTIKEALTRYVAYQQQVESVRARVVSAAVYPLLLLAVGGLVGLFLLGYVVPRFSRIYENMGDNLPWASRALMHLGQTIDNHGLLAALSVVALLVGAYTLWRQGQWMLVFIHVLNRIPAIGPQVRLYELGRFYRTLSMLLRSGMPVLAALELASGVLSVEMKVQAERGAGVVREGGAFSEAMRKHGLTTPIAYRMLVVAERSGDLGGMLERIAVFHEDELSRWVERFTRLFEPILMAVIGIVIGVIVVLMYMPIFELAEGIH